MFNIILSNRLLNNNYIIGNCGVISFENIKAVIGLTNLEYTKGETTKKNVRG